MLATRRDRHACRILVTGPRGQTLGPGARFPTRGAKTAATDGSRHLMLAGLADLILISDPLAAALLETRP